ncbi:hypothetical protein V6N13_065893 [Hibiscus sabdariffa]
MVVALIFCGISRFRTLVHYTFTCKRLICYPQRGVRVATMATEDGEWRWNLFQHLLSQFVLLRILAVKGPCAVIADDELGWIGSHKYRFTLREVYLAHALLPFGPHDII